MRQPKVYTATQLRDWNVSCEHNGRWLPARPIGHNLFSVVHRWKVAMQVLIGKLDAVNWEEVKHD